jgi:M6 family metalloprotease-like protein
MSQRGLSPGNFRKGMVARLVRPLRKNCNLMNPLSLCVISAVITAVSAYGAAPDLIAQTRSLNASLLQLHQAIQEADTLEAEALRSRADILIERRAAQLSALIEDNPAAALSIAFSPELLADLAAKFPESASKLERQGTWEGPAQAWIEDHPDGWHKSFVQLRAAEQNLRVHFDGARPNLKCGDRLRVTGVQTGNVMAAESTTALIVPNATTSSTAASPGCSTTGVQNIAALLVTFPGVAPPPNVTTQSISDILFGTAGQSVDGFWREASHGQTSAAGNVSGWYTLPTTYDCGSLPTLFNDAITLAGNSGVNFQNYTRVFIVMPNLGCGWSGLASIGCAPGSSPGGSITVSTSYLNADFLATQSHDYSVQLAAHEGGHNLGLDHAHSLSFGAEPLGPLGAAGTYAEYGDLFSDMSNQLTAHYATYHKAQLLNWMAPGTNYQLVESSGTWSLQPVESSQGGLQALKVQRGTGNNAWLWVEYRQPIGIYDSTLSGMSQVFTGALIHYDDGTASYASNLLNFVPSNNLFLTPALAAGQTWTDPYTNLSIAVQGASASALTVSVTYGAMPCTHANPVVTISPANPTVSAGTTVNYTVSVKNNDAAGCPADTFSLASSQPSNWIGAFSPTSLAISPGQNATTTLTEAIPVGASPATYNLSASASSGSYTGSASASATVATVSPALTDTESVAGSTYTTRQTLSVTAMVTSGGAAAAGAGVTFTLTKSNGTKVSGTATTDSTGKAIWSYKFAQKDPAGIYSVVNVASYKSQTVTSNTATFSVQ